MSKSTGGYAFPNITPDMNVDGGPGMTLREWYEGQALAGITANPNFFGSTFQGSPTLAAAIAKACGEAMLTARATE